MLELINIDTYIETSHIVFGLSLTVNKGEVVCLLGRNGAGKTTTIRTIMGFISPLSGSIKFEGATINTLPVFERAKRGIGYVPDDRRIFPTLSVKENLELGAKKASYGGRNLWTIEKVYELFPVLKKYSNKQGAHLSGGEQQMLAIARTLMGNPTLILMDEPTEGLGPIVVRAVGDSILKLKEIGQTILMSEQNLNLALSISDRAYVIEKGTLRFQGSIQELRENDEVKRRYLLI